MVTPRLTHVSAVAHYRLAVRFNDGTEGEIDLAGRLFGPVFESLRDEKEFQKVGIDEFGAVVWPCGADLAPDGIYRRLTTAVPAG